jgi:hypothetical protein
LPIVKQSSEKVERSNCSVRRYPQRRGELSFRKMQ